MGRTIITSLKNLPLRHKLTAIILITSGLIIMIISTILIINEAVSIRNSVFHNISALAGVTALNSTAALSFEDNETAFELLSALKIEPHIIAAAIYKANGQVFVKYSPKEDTYFPIKIDLKHLSQDNKESELIFLNNAQNLSTKYFEVIRLIKLNNKLLGAVYIKVDQSWIYQRIKLFALIVFGVMIFLFFISYSISAKLQKLVVEPIEHLVHIMKQVKKSKDYSIRVKSNYKDEIGTLMEGFNEMLEQIQLRDKELKSSQQQLAKQVSLRTEALKLSEAQKQKLWLQTRIQKAYSELVSRMNSIDLDKLLEECLEQIADVATCLVGFIYLWDREKEQLILKKTFISKTCQSKKTENSFLKLNKECILLAQMSFEQEETIEKQLSINNNFCKGLEIISFPLTFQEKRIGALILASNHTLDQYTLTFFQNAAKQLGVAIHNAMTFEDLMKKSAQLKQSNEELQRVSRMKSDFLANMSHELRTPLNAIIGFSELLLDEHFGQLNDIQKDYLTDVLNSGRHLLELINDMLDLSKVEAGKMELELSQVNIKHILESGLTMVKHKALKHNIALSLDIENAPETITADQQKLKQILFNLVSNAVKFTDDGGSIKITAQKVDSNWLKKNVPVDFRTEKFYTITSIEKQFLKISVSDTGIGISKEHIKQIFDAFEQVDSSRSKKYKGTGLGLALCKNFVELHNGLIWVESTLGVGSTFSFVIPIEDFS